MKPWLVVLALSALAGCGSSKPKAAARETHAAASTPDAMAPDAAPRLKGMAVSEACLNNPLAAECEEPASAPPCDRPPCDKSAPAPEASQHCDEFGCTGDGVAK